VRFVRDAKRAGRRLCVECPPYSEFPLHEKTELNPLVAFPSFLLPPNSPRLDIYEAALHKCIYRSLSSGLNRKKSKFECPSLDIPDYDPDVR